MKWMILGFNICVENMMKGDGSEMGVEFKFDFLEDFDLVKVVE